MTKDSFDRLVQSVVEIAPNLHGSGTFSKAPLRALARYAAQSGGIQCSVETGSGASTLLLSHLSGRHLAFTVDSGTGSLENVKSSPLFRSENVTVIEGPTQLTLPRFSFRDPIQLALIDGPHGFPFPDLDYYYIYPHIERDGVLVLDDIQIRSIHNLFEFLSADDMWHLDEVVENTSFFRRTEAPTFPTTGDGWWLQKYNCQSET